MNQVVHPQDHQSASPWIAPQAPVWLRPVPFFMSALLFMSAIFTVFSPFPLILLSFRKSFRWFWVAAASNLIIVYLLGGQTSAAFFGVLGVGTAFGISHFMVRKGFKPDQAAASTLAVLFLLSLGVGGGYWQVKRLNPWHQLAEQVGQFVEQMEKASESTSPTSTSEVPVEEMKATVISELPSSMGIFAFVVVWLNSLMLLGANPGRLREKLGIDAAYFAVWKAPEWLVWPTIGFAALMILASGRWETAGINGFKLLMAVYALQGLSVLSYLLALWRVKRFLRSIVYLMALFPMLPLLLAIGFFDLWFDFRSKIRQS